MRRTRERDPYARSQIVPYNESTRRYEPADIHRRMVAAMRANGLSVAGIADVLQIKRDTVSKLFKYELEYGDKYVEGLMGAVIVEAGLGGNIAAAKFWLATHCPAWRVAKDQLTDAPDRDDEVVRFYLPPNRRDQPEEVIEPPTIEGQVAA